MVSGCGKCNKDVLFSVHGGKAGQTQPCGGGISRFAALDLCSRRKLCSVQLAQQCAGQRNALRVLRSRCGGVVLRSKNGAKGRIVQCCLQQLCHICRAGIVLGVGQAGSVCKMSVLHTERCGFLVHQCGKVILTAAHQPRQRLTAFCTGRQHRTIEQVPHRDRLPGRKACHRCFFGL